MMRGRQSTAAPARGGGGRRRGANGYADPPPAEAVPLGEAGLEEVVRARLRAFLKRVDGYPIADLYDDVIALVERPLLEVVLEHTGGNQLRAAQVLGLNRNTLRKKLGDHGLSDAANGHRRPR